MRNIFFMAVGLLVCGCSSHLVDYKPSHIGIVPSMEMEIQSGSTIKYKPRIGSSIDWNF